MINEYITSYHLPQFAETIRIYVDSKTNEIKSTTDLIYVTYEELVKLRNDSLLKPGCFYFITDYVTTTGVANTESAEYNFPIIVLATSSNTLSEEAVTTNFGAHSHFENNNLDAWKIWYCLDNDDDRFSWAGQKLRKTCFAFQISTTEWFSFERDKSLEKIIDNTTYYGYKWESGFVQTDTFNDTTILWYNVEYPELTITYERVDTPVYVENNGNLSEMTLSGYFEEVDTGKIGKGVIYRMIDEFGNDCPYDFKNIKFKNPHDENDDTYYYTFAKAVDGNNISDASVNPYVCAKGNIIGGRYENSGKMMLPINIFCGRNVNILNNVLGNNCYDNVFGEKTSDNYNCQNNTFGNECHNNSFGNNCRYNTFGNECTDNSFGNECTDNSFGNGCTDNSFGNFCGYNSFGNLCELNSFGNNCNYNSFGNSCGGNSFGNNCYSNSFGNGCGGNSFRNSASETGVLKDYCYYNHFDDGCLFNVIWNSDTTGEDILLKNINVNRGVCGTNDSYNYINIETLNSEKEININNYNGHIYIDYGGIFNITYSELVYLRDNAHLITGRQYRIIDYVTSTSQENTQSAGHQFDIIVTALDENTLSEEAQAIQHDGDEYFSTSNLNAWKLWYSLDNDANRFEWMGNDSPVNNPTLKGINPECFIFVDGNGDEMQSYENVINDQDNNIFCWHDYTNDNEGNNTLVLYKTNINGIQQDSDYLNADSSNVFFYQGTEEYDGVIYDKWRKIEPETYTWDNEEKIFVLTQQIVENNSIKEEYLYNAESVDGKGVIYRMIDEYGNDCPYDFKNILFNYSNKNKVDSSNCSINASLVDGNSFNEPFTPVAYMFIDTDGKNFENYEGFEGKSTDDLFYEYGYETTPDGLENQLCLFKSDTEVYEDEGTDYSDKFFYWGTYDYDGEIYDIWKKAEVGDDGVMWFENEGGLGNIFILTNRIVEGEMNVSDDKNYYTFTWVDENNETHDSSIIGNDGTLRNDEDTISGVYNNVIGKYIEDGVNKLPVNIFIGDYNHENGTYFACQNNTFGVNCNNNIFGNNCYNNTFGNVCINNTFGSNCYNNTFGEDFCDNTFGNICTNNTFGNNCFNNTFGKHCINNTFGNNCYNNTFGYEYHDNTFGDNCSDNTFGHGCFNNTFGSSCVRNTFGDDCDYNTFGDDCDYNTFGDDCDYNTFGDGCGYITFSDGCYDNTLGHKCINNTFGKDCSYNTFGDDCGKNNSGNTLNSGCTYNQMGDKCYSNTLGENCYSNTFGNSCDSNTFGKHCENNTFGNDCDGNTFGDTCNNNIFSNDCESNTFGDDCGGNTFGNKCYNNTFGDECSINTFGYYCYNNTFGDTCSINTFIFACQSNTFGDGCCDNTFDSSYYKNTFGDNCGYNTFGDSCVSNTFGDDCSNNTFGNNCDENTFGNECGGNTFGNDCSDNTLGDECRGNTFGDACSNNTFDIDCGDNTFGDGCYKNTFGDSCWTNTFGDSCWTNTFGNSCGDNTFGDECGYNTFGNVCEYNTFGNRCNRNTFVDDRGNTRIYCSNNVFENDCSYNKIITPTEGSETAVLQNLYIHSGFSGKNNTDLKETVINKLNSLIEIDIYQDENGNTCINQINCGTF